MNIEKYKLWRLALSTIHIDGKVTAEEKRWFENSIKSLEQNSVLKFSEEQIAELKEILTTPVTNFLEEFNALEKPSDCAFVLHILRIVGHVDKDFGEDEKKMYKTLEQACLKGVDVASVDAETTKLENESYHEKNVYGIDNKSSRFETVFQRALRILNPGDYKYPGK